MTEPIVLSIILVILIALLGWYLLFSKTFEKILPADESDKNTHFLEIDDQLLFSKSKSSWESSLIASGTDLAESYSDIIFVHGTFAGHDLFGLTAVTKKPKSFISKIQKTFKYGSFYFSG